MRLLWIAPVILMAGCASLRLPAIDPTGEGIFLPAPAYTTIEPCCGGLGQCFGGPSAPAFGSPSPLPPEGYCGPLVPYNDANQIFGPGPWGLGYTAPTTPGAPGIAPTAPAPASPFLEGPGYLTDGHLARISVNPRRMVAPVGREVIVQAGICGADGYYLRSQPIEWSLSPDSVGTIVEVDQTNKSVWRQLFKRAPRKLSGNYAEGLTSPCDQVLPRGTPDPSDDIYLAEGQTWISLTSNAEGATHLTAVAPTIAGWEDRRDSATIHWVDGQWTLPAPLTAGSSGGVLQTRVVRATSGVPLEGWRVRYEITGGTPAAFDAAGAQSIEVVTNADGVGAATILPQGGYTGATSVLVQVIRVGANAGDLPRLVVGQGTTTVTWIADGATVPAPIPPATIETPPAAAIPPRIGVRIDGPAVAEMGAQITSTITVSNLGTTPLEGVEVVNRVPRELEYLRAQPQAGQFGDEVRWQLGGILPGDSRAIAVDYRVLSGGQIRNCVQATSSSVTVDDCATTVVQSNVLSVQLRGPASTTIPVGERVSFEVVVTNLTDRELTGVVLEDRFDAGLEHRQGASPISWEVGTLPARSTRTFPLVLTVRQPGEHCHEVTVRAGDGSQGSSRACVTGVGTAAPPSEPPRPAVEIQVQGPQQSQVGRQEEFGIVVRNVGNVPLTNIQVQASFDAELLARDTAPAARATGENGAVWMIPALGVRAEQKLGIRCEVRAGRDRACWQAMVASSENARDSQEACVDIRSDPLAPAPGGLRGSEQPGIWSPQGPGTRPLLEQSTGSDLRMTIARQVSPFSTERGNLSYRIELSNRGTRPHSDVTLRVTVPQNTTYVSSQGPPAVDVLEVSADRSQIMFRPIVTLRPDESVAFQVEVRPIAASIGKMSAEATSVEDRTGISATEP